MVYSGVILAIVSVANINSERGKEWIFWSWLTESFLSKIIAVATLLSISCSLVVVGVFWDYLEFAIPEPGRTRFQEEWDKLLKVIVVRQLCYKIAWLLAIMALLLLLFFVVAFGL